MNVQLISDAKGKTTGVFIPIEEWNTLTAKYKGIENDIDIPEWHKAIVAERNATYKTNPSDTQDFGEAMNELDKEL